MRSLPAVAHFSLLFANDCTHIKFISLLHGVYKVLRVPTHASRHNYCALVIIPCGHNSLTALFSVVSQFLIKNCATRAHPISYIFYTQSTTTVQYEAVIS